MKVGIYGGSFNPVHFGHVGLAKWVIEHTDLDELWLLVSPNNPLKDAHILAPEQERLEGVREAIKDIPGLKASDFEFSLPRPSYTANTLRELQKAYPDCEFTLVIGEDNLAIFPQWREYEFILENFRIFVYPRHLFASSAKRLFSISHHPPFAASKDVNELQSFFLRCGLQCFTVRLIEAAYPQLAVRREVVRVRGHVLY